MGVLMGVLLSNILVVAWVALICLYLFALAKLTYVLELPVCRRFLMEMGADEVRIKDICWQINMITNISLNGIFVPISMMTRFYQNFFLGYWGCVIIIEIIILFVEYGMYGYAFRGIKDGEKGSKRKLLLMSFLANLLSFSVGLVITAVIRGIGIIS